MYNSSTYNLKQFNYSNRKQKQQLISKLIHKIAQKTTIAYTSKNVTEISHKLKNVTESFHHHATSKINKTNSAKLKETMGEKKKHLIDIYSFQCKSLLQFFMVQEMHR
jgi:6-phosphogluconate dehydrogenase